MNPPCPDAGILSNSNQHRSDAKRVAAHCIRGVSCRHADCVRRMTIEDAHYFEVLTMPTVVTAAMFGTQCGSLRKLRIATADASLSGVELAALAALSRLSRLQVRAVASPDVVKEYVSESMAGRTNSML